MNFLKQIYINGKFKDVFRFLNQFTTIIDIENEIIGNINVHQYRLGYFQIDEDNTERRISFVEHLFYNGKPIYNGEYNHFIKLTIGNTGHLYDLMKQMIDTFGGFIYCDGKTEYKTKNIYNSDIKTLTSSKFLEGY